MTWDDSCQTITCLLHSPLQFVVIKSVLLRRKRTATHVPLTAARSHSHLEPLLALSYSVALSSSVS